MVDCRVNGNVEVWKDGQALFSQTAQAAQRPDPLWFAKPLLAGGGAWSPASISRARVRGGQPTLTDLIFRDDFEAEPGLPWAESAARPFLPATAENRWFAESCSCAAG
jgi:hypothetical protein